MKKALRALAPSPLAGPRSAAMRALEAELEQLRSSDCNVLILGETGTGKSMLARRIHALGLRSRGPFVDVNCAGLAHDFVQSELFGHERGSFTGAYATTQGLLDAAHAGTLFLDEIGDMDIRVQPKLLKVLEEKRFRRIGDNRERTVDVRLVAATHRDLLDSVDQNLFRQDLYYRISTVTLTMPPLRDRTEDVLPIAAEMLARFTADAPGPVQLSTCAAEKLLEHAWPGNLRELRSVLERALLRRKSEVIQPEDLKFDPVRRVQSSPGESGVHVKASRLLADDAGSASRSRVESEHIRLALESEDGCVQRAARRLGISRSTLYTKMKLYAIDQEGRRRPLAKATA